jgi:hypothetical protein
MQTSDLDHSHEITVDVQPSMGRYLVLFTAIFFALTAINAFLVISQVMTLLSPFLAAYLTGLVFIKKRQQLPSKAQGKTLRRGATLIYGLLLLINIISSSVATAAVTDMPFINTTTIGLLASAAFALAVSYLIIALGFWLANVINKRILAST